MTDILKQIQDNLAQVKTSINNKYENDLKSLSKEMKIEQDFIESIKQKFTPEEIQALKSSFKRIEDKKKASLEQELLEIEKELENEFAGELVIKWKQEKWHCIRCGFLLVPPDTESFWFNQFAKGDFDRTDLLCSNKECIHRNLPLTIRTGDSYSVSFIK